MPNLWLICVKATSGFTEPVKRCCCWQLAAARSRCRTSACCDTHKQNICQNISVFLQTPIITLNWWIPPGREMEPIKVIALLESIHLLYPLTAWGTGTHPGQISRFYPPDPTDGLRPGGDVARLWEMNGPFFSKFLLSLSSRKCQLHNAVANCYQMHNYKFTLTQQGCFSWAQQRCR